MGGILSGIGKVQRKFLPVNLATIIENSIEQYRMADPNYNAFFRMEMLPIVEGDGKMLRSLFDELISNALKFKREDIRPVVEIFGQKEKNNIWRISIFDNGIGFDQNVSTKIFRSKLQENDIKAGKNNCRGLKICKEIVDYHHGTIFAKSILGQGAKFTIRLPEKQSQE